MRNVQIIIAETANTHTHTHTDTSKTNRHSIATVTDDLFNICNRITLFFLEKQKL